MPIKPEREYRRIDPANLETRDDEEGKMLVRGYATTFGDEYCLWDDGNWSLWESVDPHAFDGCDMSDVIMQYDHQGRVFARTKNSSLQLTVDDHGLMIEANLAGTDIGHQLYQEIRGGYTDKMSFGFTVRSDTKTEETVEGKTRVHRVITGISKLYDVSAVSLPANDATEISARHLSEGVIAEITEERRVREERERRIRKLKILMEVLKHEH